MNTITNPNINGIDTDALRGAIEAIRQDAAAGQTSWHVTTTWRGGTRSDTQVSKTRIGTRQIPRDFSIRIDEPFELCGANEYANPQEYLLAALNACMTVGYVAGCAVHGITLRELRIETGEIDLRGMFELEDSVVPGYKSLRYTIHIKADAPREQIEKIHQTVIATSPNRYNLAHAIKMNSTLVVQE